MSASLCSPSPPWPSPGQLTKLLPWLPSSMASPMEPLLTLGMLCPTPPPTLPTPTPPSSTTPSTPDLSTPLLRRMCTMPQVNLSVDNKQGWGRRQKKDKRHKEDILQYC